MEKRIAFKISHKGRIAAECKIQFAFCQHICQYIRAFLHQCQPDSRVFLTESGKHYRKNIGIEIVRSPLPDLSGIQILNIGYLVFQILLQRFHSFNCINKNFPGSC